MFWMIPIAGIMLAAVAVWSDNRRREREAFYQHEIYRKMMEQPGASVQSVGEFMQGQEELRRQSQRQSRIEGLKLGGLITASVGIGVAVFLYYVMPGRPVYLAGLIPLLVGVALLLFSYFIADRSHA